MAKMEFTQFNAVEDKTAPSPDPKPTMQVEFVYEGNAMHANEVVSIHFNNTNLELIHDNGMGIVIPMSKLTLFNVECS